MKYEYSVEIAVPVDKVVALFKNPKHFKEWRDGFVSHEPISGTPGTVGAKSKITYVNGPDTIVVTETIMAMNLPHERIIRYEHANGENIMTHQFTEVPADKTNYTASIEYINGKGLKPIIKSMFMSDKHGKEDKKWLRQFKTFAQREYWTKSAALKDIEEGEEG